MGRGGTASVDTFVIGPATSSAGWSITATLLDARCTSLTMAHVEKRGHRKRPWRARYRSPDGQERSRSFVRRSDADAFLATVENAKLRGEWRNPALGRTTFASSQ